MYLATIGYAQRGRVRIVCPPTTLEAKIWFGARPATTDSSMVPSFVSVQIDRHANRLCAIVVRREHLGADGNPWDDRPRLPVAAARASIESSWTSSPTNMLPFAMTCLLGRGCLRSLEHSARAVAAVSLSHG
jgi:hypothetical protein